MRRVLFFVFLLVALLLLKRPAMTSAQDFAVAGPRAAVLNEDQQALDQLELLEILKNAPPAPNPPSMFESSDEVSAAADQTATVCYDLTIGEEELRPSGVANSTTIVPPDAPSPGEESPFNVLGTVAEGADFAAALATIPTPPEPVYNTTVQPWNTIHKLLVRFNSGGTDYFYVCSAMAVGSFHVVTAGHCIFNWDPNNDGNISDRTWADEIWIWAGQTDQVNPVGVPDRPYGLAKATYLRSYTGWTENQNLDHDWGVITLNRRDGDHTGWMGRETVTTDSLNYGGYPVETPYVPAGTLVQYFGYDPGNVVLYTCCRIILNAFIYGGHSGGPSWRYDGVDRWIQGIHSTSNRVGTAVDTYFTDGKRLDLNSYMAADETDRPPVARPDQIEYLFDGNNSKDLLTNTAGQGEPIQIEYNVMNSGFVNSGDFTVSFYLSTNDVISTSDTLIGTRTHNLDAFSYVNPTATLTVPASQTPGTYYVGWIISGGVTEYATLNNTVVIDDETLTVTLCASSGSLQCGGDFQPFDCCSNKCGIFNPPIAANITCIDDISALGPGACNWGFGWYSANGVIDAIHNKVCCNGVIEDLATCDRDLDGIPEDGNGSGVIGDAPCTGGQTASCDDNCPDNCNAEQLDADSDGTGDVCDQDPGCGGCGTVCEQEC